MTGGLPGLLLTVGVIALLAIQDPGASPAKVPLVVPTARHAKTGLDDWSEIRAAIRPRVQSELELAGLKLGAPVFIRIFKQTHELQIFVQDGQEYRHFRTYPICRFSGDPGPKLREGDLQSPEGFYTVTAAQLNPNSKFHLSFDLGYPNAFDQSHQRTGSALMVHGNCVSIGCYAMTDAGIEEVYLIVEAALKNGQSAVPVHAFPFRMSQAIPPGEWAEFWANLQQGYAAFEATKNPPKVSTRGGRYVITLREG